MSDLPSFSIGLCQFNSTVGDLVGNVQKIISYIKESEEEEIDLLIFPELTLTGYSPMDLLYYSSISRKIDGLIGEIVKAINSDITIIVGTPMPLDDPMDRTDQRYFNSALVINKSGVIKQVNKSLLPDYGVFNEKRHFVSDVFGDDPEQGLIDLFGVKIGIEICEDMWSHMPIYGMGEYEDRETDVTRNLVTNGAKLIINISASPYCKNKVNERLKIVKSHAEKNEVPFIYVNEVGGMDEVVFDGNSFVVNSDGELVYATPLFEEGIFKLNSDQIYVKGVEDGYYNSLNLPREEFLLKAITTNLRDYLKKIGFNNKLLVAISGGIDSALTASLCAMAVGPERVIGVSLPSKYSSNHSLDDAKELADNLGIEFHNIAINDIHKQFTSTLQPMLDLDLDGTLADENIQSRIRGDIMMYLSNLWGHILISTGNKSEIAVGYCTLYGDTAGGKNLLGDVYKTEVYSLSKYINEHYPKYRIPLSSIEKTPSAELRENQKDSDSLPEYEQLDKILEMIIDLRLSSDEVIAFGEDPETVKKIAQLIQGSEFKRAQMVQTVRVTDNAFGMGRVVPTASKFEY